MAKEQKTPKRSILRSILVVAVGSATLLMTATLLLKMDEFHNLYLRSVVGDKVYMVKGKMNGGGGTGFAVQAPSGQSYVVTNSHVCEGVLRQTADPAANQVIVVTPTGPMVRRILQNSDTTDLCIIEGIPGVTGLQLGEMLMNGEFAFVVGHPLLRPLTVTRGEIVGKMDVTILDHFMEDGEDDAKCSKPKNLILHTEIDFFGIIKIPVKVCLVITKAATMTTATIFPGNSGSPLVDWMGNIVGVAFASDNTNWGIAVSLSDLRSFLSHY
jgi:S1-C subfamily serine protease